MDNDEIREIHPEDFEDDDMEDIQAFQPRPQKMESIPMSNMAYVNLEQLDRQSARLEMVRHTYQTPKDRLSELTYLGRHETANLALMIMFNELSSPNHVPGTAFQVWLEAFFALRRSVNGRHLGKAYQLAEAGMLTEQKDFGGMAVELD